MSRSILAVVLAAAVAGCSSGSDAPEVTIPGCELTNSCEPPPCEPTCTGRECGDDGCGGSCGTCAEGNSCEAFACVPPVEEPPEEPVSACPGRQRCVVAVYQAWSHLCTRASASAPWECTPLFLEGSFPNVAQCEMTCTGGESACHEGDTDVGEACRRCEAGCAIPVYETCPDQPADVCAAPCACR